MKNHNKSVYLALGSNLGDRIKNIKTAILMLSKNSSIQVCETSSLYETEPVGYKDQEWFINQVIKIETTLCPLKLLDIMQGIEKCLGRRRGVKWGPRTIDIDILLYEKLIINSLYLTLPHPRLQERRFVLVPLAQIAPSVIHPTLGVSILKILIDTEDENLVKKIIERNNHE